ncbi:hypothetical protein C8R42DRAFT_720712 [Lentinula raphanica]|nr:hypothetical protein C8R42DRAFT_722009 [Lentinula raphanica]KAJ3722340.1 hypothetical protein C8R42DRAFT_720712 [Lentinula raphanica]
MSLPKIRYVRYITCEAAEIAQLVRRITASKIEMEKLRTEGDELVQQIKQLVKMKDIPPVLQPLDDLNALHTELAASLEAKRLDIRQLEEELLLLNKSNTPR